MNEGFVVDKIFNILKNLNIKNYLVSVGGAIKVYGHNAKGENWKIAIHKPTDRKEVIQKEIINIKNYGISTSGSYRNYYKLNGKNISHIIDPKTGYPINHNLVSVTVISKSAMEADAWDTALMVLGLDKAKKIALKENLSVYLIFKVQDNFFTWISPNLKKFINEN